jgi:GTP:adenosylcobinamide-phosphate guanylyltransferase
MVAALVVFALTPLQRFVERVATAAMPNTHNTPEYAASRKLQVYESALGEALLEGGISDKERSLLNTLRDTLGISASDAVTLEIDLQAQSA